jgi:hypothetical protein
VPHSRGRIVFKDVIVQLFLILLVPASKKIQGIVGIDYAGVNPTRRVFIARFHGSPLELSLHDEQE